MINTITEVQKAKFSEYVDKWLQIGLSTEPANFDVATAAALEAYKLCNLDKPMIVLRMSSPYGATLGGALAWGLLNELKQKTSKQVRSQVESQVESQVRSQVESQVWSEVESQVWSQVESQVRSQLESQVESQVWSQVWSQVGSQLKNSYYNYRCGNLWSSGWCAYIDFMRQELDFKVIKNFEIDEILAKSCGWVWWHENILAISDRPIHIKRDEQGRLHSETGSSMAYRDGWELYHWHGVAVPREWIENKKELTALEVLKVESTEQRAAGCEIVGWAKIEKELGAKVINDSGNQDIGSLIEMKLPGLTEKGRFLKAWCPRNGWIYEGVPKVSEVDNLPINTALAAQAWRIGDSQSEYIHPMERT